MNWRNGDREFADPHENNMQMKVIGNLWIHPNAIEYNNL
jgi:hypothetical protein